MTKRVLIIAGLILLLLVAGGSYLYWQRVRADVRTSAFPSGFNVWMLDSLEKQTKNTALAQNPNNSIAISAAQNEYQSFQIVIRPENTSSVKFELNDFRAGENVLSKSNLKFSQEDYVNVNPQSDAWGAAGQWPDPLTGIAENQSITIPGDQRSNFFVDVYVPENQTPGDYQTTINLVSGQENYPLQVSLRVWNFSLPDEMHFKSAFGYDWQKLRTAYGFGNGTSPDDARQVQRLFEQLFNPSLTENRISHYDPQLLLWYPTTFSGTQAQIPFNFADTAIANWVTNGKFNTFRLIGPNYQIRPSVLAGFPKLSAEYNEAYVSYFRNLSTHPANQEVLNKSWVYLADELCSPEAYQEYRQYYDLIKQANPQIRVGLSFHYNYFGAKTCNVWDELNGDVDLWIANLGTSWQTDKIRERLQQGNEVWLYLSGAPVNSSSVPGIGGPNYFIDQPSINQRIEPWLAYQQGVTGILYWSTNFWKKTIPDQTTPDFANPWQDPNLYVNQAGGGFLYYPPCGKEVDSGICPEEEIQKVVPSLRLKMIRDGIEDYEYLWLLEQNIGRQGALNFVNQLVTDKTDFGSAEDLEQIRNKIGEGLSNGLFNYGDLNCDKVVNEADLSIALTNWNTNLNNQCQANLPINELTLSQILSNWRHQY